MTARERRLRELVAEGKAAAIRWGCSPAFVGHATVAARYVAEKLLDEIDKLTKDCNRAVKLAAKTKGRK